MNAARLLRKLSRANVEKSFYSKLRTNPFSVRYSTATRKRLFALYSSNVTPVPIQYQFPKKDRLSHGSIHPNLTNFLSAQQTETFFRLFFRRERLMNLDISKPGLYYLLNTPAVQERIRQLGLKERVSFERGNPEVVVHLLSQAIASEIESRLLGAMEASGSPDEKPENDSRWIASLLDRLSDQSGIGTLPRDERPVTDEILSEVKLVPKAAPLPRPNTELTQCHLIVPDGKSPQLGNEIAREIPSADHVDWIVSFIKLSAVNAFFPQLLAYCSTPRADGAPKLRIATTTYIGATDASALEKLFRLPNTQIKVCFNSSQTRLHAKAYIFRRDSGFGSAYIGSANLSSAALSSGMEWTVKVSQSELPNLWERTQIAFESCWNDPNFETCTADDLPRIRDALNAARIVSAPAGPAGADSDLLPLFRWEPHAYQRTMLERLAAEREEGRNRHLVVSATGTGKTIVAVFDYQAAITSKGRPSLLYVAHRTDILHSAAVKYRAVLGDRDFGFVPSDGAELTSANVRQTFCTLQTWRSRIKGHPQIERFDRIVLDECHHAEAASYKELLDYYREDVDAGRTDLLGLTATPFRSDGKPIKEEFGGSFTHELSLPEAIENGHIVPFDYFGIDDETRFDDVRWGQNEAADIERAILRNGEHLGHVYRTVAENVGDIPSLRGIGFCAGVEHARRVCAFMNEHGIPSTVLTGDSKSEERQRAMDDLSAIPPRLHFIFTADLFNEGVDIPAVNTILMLRPTNSPLIFLQQLGRGLRQAPVQYGKNALLVLDFVGNHNARFKGYLRFKFLSSRPDVPLTDQIEAGMPFLPPGCSVTLTAQAREKVLANIRANLATLRGQSLRRHLVEAIREKRGHIALPELMHRIQTDSPAPIYSVGRPFELEREALTNVSIPDLDRRGRRFHVLAQNDSRQLLQLWKRLLARESVSMPDEDVRLAKFFLLSAFDPTVRTDFVDDGWRTLLGQHEFVRDLREFIDWRLDTLPIERRIVFPEKTSRLLELHRTYTTQQISAALGNNGYNIQKGTHFVQPRQTDVFFITKQKSGQTLTRFNDYDDYALSERLFHWSGPHDTGTHSKAGMRWISDTSTKMLFIRRAGPQKLDVSGTYPVKDTTAGFVFLGPVRKTLGYHETGGVLKFTFEMEHPLPADVFEYAKEA